MYKFISPKKINAFFYITIIMTALWELYGSIVLHSGEGDELYFITIAVTILGIFISFILRSLYYIAQVLEGTSEQLYEVRRQQRKQSGE